MERRLLIEALLRLAQADYCVQDYRYVGFGSVYYADFVLFHKYLYITDMWCIEGSDVPRRMRFNKPYRFIKLKMNQYSNVIPSLSRRKKHVVWLDYDYALDDTMLADIDGTLHTIAPGSIFVVTMDARAALPERYDKPGYSQEQREDLIAELYNEWFGPLVGRQITTNDLGANDIPLLFVQSVRERIEMTLLNRDGLEFRQLFNCVYADKALMLTFGGVLDTPDRLAGLDGSSVMELPFINGTEEPIEVSVPHLTLREKQWLDKNLNDTLTADRVVFEIREEYFDNYRKYYRDYPTYTEALM